MSYIKEPKKILISAQMGIGNMIMFLPFLNSLRAHFTQSHIAVVFSLSNGSDEVLKKLSPGLIDEIIFLENSKSNLLVRLYNGFRLGLRNWDMVIYRFNGYRIDLILATFISFTKYRVGHTSSLNWKNRFDFIINYPVVLDENKHEIDNYLDILTVLNIPIISSKPKFSFSEASVESLFAKSSSKISLLGENFIVLAPGTSTDQSWKRWPIKYWHNLILHLTKLGVFPVFVGGENDKILINSITYGLDSNLFASFVGELNLLESSVLITKSILVVCCDSSILHIAHAVEVPVIGLFGPTDDNRTGYSDSKSFILRSEFCKGACYSISNSKGHENCDITFCMNSLTVSNLISKIMEILSKH